MVLTVWLSDLSTIRKSTLPPKFGTKSANRAFFEARTYFSEGVGGATEKKVLSYFMLPQGFVHTLYLHGAIAMLNGNALY